MPSPYGRQRAVRTVASVADLASELGREPRLADARGAEDRHEPAAAGPRRRRRARAERSRARRARPTSGASSRRANAAAPRSTPSSAPRLDGRALALRLIGATGSSSTAFATSRRVAAPIEDLARPRRLLEPLRRVHRVARDERRRLVAGDDLAGVDPDPDAQRGPPRAASSSFSASSAARISSAARTARSASSSWTCGTPKTAITASPMNFSTLPPCALDGVRASRRTSGPSARGAPRGRAARRARSTGEVAEEDADRLPRGGGRDPSNVTLYWAEVPARPRYTGARCSTPFPTSSRARSATSAAAARSTRRRSRARCARSGSRCSRPTSTSTSSSSSSRRCASARSARTSRRA